MAPCLEILVAKPTEDYHNDPTLSHPIFDIVGAAEGCLGIYYGTALEDRDMLVLLIPWRTLEDHLALINDKERYGRMGAHFVRCADMANMDLFHTTLDVPLGPVLRAPYVSFVRVKGPAPGHTLEELLKETAAIARVTDVQGCTGGGWGKAHEKDEVVLLHGWEDPKYHAEVAKLESVQEGLKPWREVSGEMKTVHVPLTTFKKYEGQ